MQFADQFLDVLGVDIAAVDDQQILEAARDEQLVLMQQPEITGAQKGPLGTEVGVEGFAGLVSAVPIAGGDALAADPDLADSVLRQLLAPMRVDDANVETTGRRSAA